MSTAVRGYHKLNKMPNCPDELGISFGMFYEEDNESTCDFEMCMEWTSQAQGSSTTKIGKVHFIIPAGNDPIQMRQKINPGWQQGEHNFKEAFGGGQGRDHESYVILVPPKSSRAKGTLYWPIVSKLKLVEK